MKPYSNLSNAIIIRAVDDYRSHFDRLNYLLREPSFNGRRIVETKREIDKIEGFFHSEWYSLITNISPEDVIKKVRKEVERCRAWRFGNY